MPDVAFVDVNVVPMDGAAVLEHRTVIVEGDRIARIAPAGEVTPRPGVTAIDGRGRYLMPGLADMHAHYQSKECAALFLANGVTTVRVMWGRPHHLKERDRIARGERIGPAMVCAGNIVDGDPPTWGGMTSIGDPAEADAAVEAQHRQGYDFVKVYNLLSPIVFDAIIEAAGRRNMQVAGHLPAAVSIEHALRAGMASIEHTQGLLKEIQGAASPMRGKIVDSATLIAHMRHSDASLIPGLARRACAISAARSVRR